MDRVYSEARTLLNNGFRYWFDDIEIEELHRGNTAFHVQTIEYEMLLKRFERRSKRIGGNPVYGWVIEKIVPNPFVSYGL